MERPSLSGPRPMLFPLHHFSPSRSREDHVPTCCPLLHPAQILPPITRPVVRLQPPQSHAHRPQPAPHSRLSHLSRGVTQLNRTLAPWARRGASKQEEGPGEPATPGTKGPPGKAPSHRGQEVRVSVLVLWVCQKDLGKNPEELLIHR